MDRGNSLPHNLASWRLTVVTPSLIYKIQNSAETWYHILKHHKRVLYFKRIHTEDVHAILYNLVPRVSSTFLIVGDNAGQCIKKRNEALGTRLHTMKVCKSVSPLGTFKQDFLPTIKIENIKWLRWRLYSIQGGPQKLETCVYKTKVDSLETNFPIYDVL